MNIGEKFYCSKCLGELEGDEAEGVCPKCGYDPSEAAGTSFLEEGALLYNGHYQVGAVIDQGGFGVTYAAWDLVLDQAVAIKEYFPRAYVTRNVAQDDAVAPNPQDFAYYEIGLRTFIREARILAMLQNVKTVVEVKDCFEENNTAYIVMEYVRGETLMEYCQKNKVPPKALLKMLRPVIDDLILIHQSGILHRDISPSNLMVQADGALKLIDFGAAVVPASDGEKNLFLNRSFSAPEQYEPDGEQGGWTDVYGLAATLYTMISGCSVPDAKSRLQKDTLETLQGRSGPVRPRLRKAICKGLALSTKTRTRSMEVFRADLYHLPKPIETKKQKFIAGLKIAVIILAVEAIAALFARAYRANLARQVQLAAGAYLWEDTEAAYTLASNYARGSLGEEQFPENPELSAYWFQWAAKHGNTAAMVDYAFWLTQEGSVFPQDIPLAIMYFEDAAQADEPAAMGALGALYLDGEHVEQDLETAFSYLTKSAEAGYSSAMVILGSMYQTGAGCEIDEKKAFACYQAASDLGDSEGMLHMAYCYADGVGVAKDDLRALSCLYEAAADDCGEAMYRLGELYQTGRYGFVDYEQAAKWYNKAIRVDYGGGFYGLAILYRDGLGVNADQYAASRNMLLAFLWDFEPAQAECDAMNATGYGIFGSDSED